MASPPSDTEPEIVDTTPDPAHQFYPTRILYIHKTSLLKTVTQVLDLTPHLLQTYDPQTGISPSFLTAAKKAASPSSSPTPETLYTLTSSLLSSTLTAFSPSPSSPSSPLATASSPLLSLGTTTITFPDGSPHGSHPIELKPLGLGRHAEGFVKDSVRYVWEVERFRTEIKTLWETLGPAGERDRVEVARYVQGRAWEREGVSALDEGAVGGGEPGELVVVLTLVAVLGRRDSFAK